jgi:hypothetical protein
MRYGDTNRNPRILAGRGDFRGTRAFQARWPGCGSAAMWGQGFGPAAGLRPGVRGLAQLPMIPLASSAECPWAWRPTKGVSERKTGLRPCQNGQELARYSGEERFSRPFVSSYLPPVLWEPRAQASGWSSAGAALIFRGAVVQAPAPRFSAERPLTCVRGSEWIVARFEDFWVPK